ncbi:hypothetical protein [Bifidobacterium sp. ESL0827]|uniref:hypothetical protein n=1 Tax=Bifidobacterium sp. ESL0827 TaxID=3448583 RepID=UPI004043878A
MPKQIANLIQAMCVPGPMLAPIASILIAAAISASAILGSSSFAKPVNMTLDERMKVVPL